MEALKSAFRYCRRRNEVAYWGFSGRLASPLRHPGLALKVSGTGEQIAGNGDIFRNRGGV